MKVGDLVKVDDYFYPRLAGKTGILVKQGAIKLDWLVMIGGRIHPYFICESSLEVVSENR